MIDTHEMHARERRYLARLAKLIFACATFILVLNLIGAIGSVIAGPIYERMQMRGGGGPHVPYQWGVALCFVNAVGAYVARKGRPFLGSMVLFLAGIAGLSLIMFYIGTIHWSAIAWYFWQPVVLWLLLALFAWGSIKAENLAQAGDAG